jgi:hypothetical protein
MQEAFLENPHMPTMDWPAENSRPAQRPGETKFRESLIQDRTLLADISAIKPGVAHAAETEKKAK